MPDDIEIQFYSYLLSIQQNIEKNTISVRRSTNKLATVAVTSLYLASKLDFWLSIEKLQVSLCLGRSLTQDVGRK